jgi:tRNA threonylcarbamoyl adenosine modification protein YeaZ
VLALGLDTATAATSAALVEVTPDRVIRRAEQTVVAPRAHGESLAPQIVGLLAEAGVGPGALAAVVAGTGPGPFTGLRVGLATAAALGHALGIPTYPVCSLDGLAAAAGPAAGRLLAATDAQRQEIYWAVYDDRGVRLAGPAVDRPARVARRLPEFEVRAAVGAGAHRYPEALGVPVWDQPRFPSAYQLVVLAADRVRSGAPGEPLLPRYLRRPDTAPPRPPTRLLPR